MALDPLWTYDDAGLTVPDATALKSQAIEALRDPARLGGDYLAHAQDPITNLVEIVTVQLASAYQALEIVNSSRSPDEAQGASLRSVGSIVGAEIPVRSRSVITGRLLGNPGGKVPAQSILKYKPNNTLWRTFVEYTIAANGQVDAELESLEFGPIDAEASANTAWEIQSPQPNWTGFLATDDAAPGSEDPTDEEVRAAIAIAATGGGGAATFDTDVQNVLEVDGVSYVALFVNRDPLVYDVDQDLGPKEAHFVVEGGRKQDIFDAILATQSTGLNTEDTGSVQGTSTASNGKVIPVSYSRPVNVRFYMRVTITKDDDLLPDDDEVEEAVLGIIAERVLLQNVHEDVVPEQYRSAIVAGFAENAILKCEVEARLDPGDPWVDTPLAFGLLERAIIYTEPTSGELLGNAEEPVALLAGTAGIVVIDGVNEPVALTADQTTIAGVVEDISSQLTSGTAIDADGRLLLRSNGVGPTSTISAGGALFIALGFGAGLVGEGTNGDAIVTVL